MPYGVQAGAPLMPESEAFGILDLAVERGISFFDTAAAYGESETRLGKYQLAAKAPAAEISTKISRTEQAIWSSEPRYREFVRASIAASRVRLGLESLGLLQFHQCALEFLSAPSVRTVLGELIEQGLCREIGISVYTPEQALAALEIESVRALQVPFNLLDRRFAEPELRRRCEARGVRLIGRSVFLQGVLVEGIALPPVTRAAELAELRASAEEICRGLGLSLREAALAYGFGAESGLSVLLLGADSVEGLRQNLDTLEALPNVAQLAQAFEKLAGEAGRRGLIDPSTWNAR